MEVILGNEVSFDYHPAKLQFSYCNSYIKN